MPADGGAIVRGRAMTGLRYSPKALRADFIRAGVGTALTFGPLATVPAGSPSRARAGVT